jgi:hypothetical protein
MKIKPFEENLLSSTMKMETDEEQYDGIGDDYD